eukprot:scaffold4474_cov140-Isochrysis_galbana.AAC.1
MRSDSPNSPNPPSPGRENLANLGRGGKSINSWGRSACRCRASIACAACGCAGAPAGTASSSRGPRLRPPPARVPLARRRRPSLARYRLSCVWRLEGKPKIGDPETCQLYNISVDPGELPLLSFYIVKP